MSVRVRFSPNPSGDLHVGSAHTALFNWVYARHHDGVFILRIEDTDPATSKPELIEPLMEGLRWLGMDWDEGPDVGGPFEPYRDLERRPMHEAVVEQLLEDGHAYRCWCTREDLKARGVPSGYDRHCRGLSAAERASLEASGEPAAVRFAVPEDRRSVTVHDLIMGEVVSEDLQDRVIARSDGSPLYLLAVTADDIAMQVTHVIRGADLLPSTPLQVLITEALGAELPAFAHLPLLLRPDKSKLSKRKGDEGVLEFREAGILPEAMVNFLALLGWSSPSQEEILSVDRIMAEFSLERLGQSASVFDREKLTWLNQQYVQTLELEDFERRVVELDPEVPVEVLRETLRLEMIQTRVETLREVGPAVAYLHTRPDVEEKAAAKWLGTEEADRTLSEVADVLEDVEPWDPDAIREAVQAKIAELGLHKRKGPKPIFVAVAGAEVALPIFQSIYIIGREESVERLRVARSV